ncbi:hypothetical protein ACU21_01535 [Actinobaculum suis]|uniref:hypothetical protein n=1 Tax=Actinobaculum suis TaxID=1657 RepID=UPI0008086EA9|nr:hypothetical protein [Actinobaculum suis]OCA93156.1 hypothetical protein ACU21_01535 [Actinobaculum suis]
MIVNMSNPAESIVLIPHISGFYPLDMIGVISLHRGGPSGVQGGLLNTTGIDYTAIADFLADFIAAHRNDVIVLVWYGSNLEEMAGSDIASILHRATKSINHESGLYAFATDYQHWASMKALADSPDVPVTAFRSYSELEFSGVNLDLIYSGSAPKATPPAFVLDPVDIPVQTRNVLEGTPLSLKSYEQIWRNIFSKLEEATPTKETITEFVGGEKNIGHLIYSSEHDYVFLSVMAYAAGTLPSPFTVTNINQDQFNTTLDHLANPDRIAKTIELLRLLCTYCPTNLGNMHALTGYLYWIERDPNPALAYAKAALNADPRNRIARLLLNLIATKMVNNNN